jgi:hypothetical protein
MRMLPSTNPDTPTHALLGACPLIRGEDGRSYDELHSRIRNTLRPADCMEEIWIRDIVDLVWDTFRLRRMKANLLTDATCVQVGETLTVYGLHPNGRFAAERWAAGDDDGSKHIEGLLASAGITMDVLMARGLAASMAQMEHIDRALVSVEARRSAALRELDCHRGPLARKLRRAIACEEEAVADAPGIAALPEPV